jgi:hypothetical protein
MDARIASDHHHCHHRQPMTLTTDDRIDAGEGGTVLGVEDLGTLDVVRGDETLTVGDLFYDGFVSAHTDADTFEAFVARSPLAAGTAADLDGVSRAELDAYVAEHTDFESWAWMVRAACEEYVQRRTTY